jgi:hypothetical protein
VPKAVACKPSVFFYVALTFIGLDIIRCVAALLCYLLFGSPDFLIIQRSIDNFVLFNVVVSSLFLFLLWFFPSSLTSSS